MNDLIELAKTYMMEKGNSIQAFFCLALEAVEQLKRITNAQEKIAKRLELWDAEGTLSVTQFEP